MESGGDELADPVDVERLQHRPRHPLDRLCSRAVSPNPGRSGTVTRDAPASSGATFSARGRRPRVHGSGRGRGSGDPARDGQWPWSGPAPGSARMHAAAGRNGSRRRLMRRSEDPHGTNQEGSRGSLTGAKSPSTWAWTPPAAPAVEPFYQDRRDVRPARDPKLRPMGSTSHQTKEHDARHTTAAAGDSQAPACRAAPSSSATAARHAGHVNNRLELRGQTGPSSRSPLPIKISTWSSNPTTRRDSTRPPRSQQRTKGTGPADVRVPAPEKCSDTEHELDDGPRRRTGAYACPQMVIDSGSKGCTASSLASGTATVDGAGRP